MRIGLINQLHGKPGSEKLAPRWASILERVQTAEAVGFDTFVYEDALVYKGDDSSDGCWEGVSISAALAASTDRIEFGPSVFNMPYRSPAMLVKIADTIDEISGGRFIFGIGAGNTPDSDYEAFGFPTDRRYSRFAEAIEIIHSLRTNRQIDFEGEFYSVKGAERVLTGPRPNGPPISVAAGGPRMLRLVAQYADAWNWWGWDETIDQLTERVTPIIDQLNQACEDIGRDPGTLTRTFDLYSVVPPGFSNEGSGMERPVGGDASAIEGFLVDLHRLGFSEVRCDLTDKTIPGIEAMRPVVEAVHSN